MKISKIILTLFKNQYFWLGLILIFAFWVRTYRIDRPIADWHSWRQADTAAVSRNFVKYGFTILTPRFDDLSPLAENDLPNPQGFRYVEFPIYNILVGLAWLVFPYEEAAARLVSIVLSLGSTVFLFLITRRYLGNFTALVASFIFAFLPYNIFYSTAILPEPLLIFSILTTLYFFDIWLEGGKNLRKNVIFGSLAVIFSAMSLLTKPTALFMFIPIFYLAYNYYGLSFYKSLKVWLILILTLIPFGVWRIIASQHPEGIPRYKWLLNGDRIRFKGAFFYWIFQDRISRLLIGGSGFALLILGLLNRTSKERFFFFSWLFAMALYVVVFATGNVTHDYYQAPLVPIFSIFVAKGFSYLIFKKADLFERAFYIFLAVFLIGLMFGIRWREVKNLFNINNPKIVEVGQVADRILPQDAKVIAPYNGDTAFLYQTNRQGWASVYLPINEIIANGATHYVTVSLNDEAHSLMKQYKTLYSSSEFAIIDLTQKNLSTISHTP